MIKVLPLGDSAFVIRLGDTSIDSRETLSWVLETVERLQGAALPWVIEVAPAYASVGVFCEPPRSPAEADAMRANIETLLAIKQRKGSKPKGRTFEIPVCYCEEFALDLADLARRAGLSEEEIVRRHASGEYLVRCVGFLPGFPYLSGLPTELAAPRRATPRIKVPAGSVAIGGAQAGIYPQDSPGGWNVIGRTPVALFNPESAPPALLAAGDLVRFRSVTRAEFDAFAR